MAQRSKFPLADSGHRMSISTSADTLIAENSIDEVKKAIDAAGLVRRKASGDPQIRALLKSAVSPQWLNCPI